MLNCYYAHFMGTYDTPVEERDMELLKSLGLKVTNPNCKPVQEAFLRYKADHEEYMTFFCDLAASHDVVAFRGLPDGTIPAGVAKEIEAAREAGRIIIEIPSGLTRRFLGVKETREYLADMGER